MPKFYRYPQTQNVKTSLDICEITPVYWNKLYPGDKLENFSFKNITRMITPLYPTLDNPYIDLFAFWVPKRIYQLENTSKNPEYKPLVFDQYRYSSDYSSVLFPQSTWVNPVLTSFEKKELIPNEATFFSSSNLLKKIGYSLVESGGIGNENLCYYDLSNVFAYHKIYFDFFRNKQLEQFDYNIFYNIFTGNNEYRDLSLNTLIAPVSSPVTPQQKYNNYIWRYFNSLHSVNVDNDFLNSLTYVNINAPLSGQVSWNNLKKMFSTNYINNDKIIDQIDYGTQKDILLNVWNVNNGDKTSSRLIGYERYNQTITQVVNQAQTSTNALGEIGGLSCTYNNGTLVNSFEANEEGIFMVLAVPNFKTTLLNVSQPNDFLIYNDDIDYNPEVDYIQQPLYNYSFGFIDYDVDDVKDIFAYSKPFDILRQKNDLVAGEMVNSWVNWTYSFDPSDSLLTNHGFSVDLLKTKKEIFKKTLVSPTQDSFITEWLFSGDFYRSLKPDFIISDTVITGEN